MDSWYKRSTPLISFKEGKSLLRNFFVYGKKRSDYKSISRMSS